MENKHEQEEESGLDKLYSHYAARVERQDSLINQRLKWMMTSQGVLFSLVAAFINYESGKTDKLLLFAFIGVIVGLLISISGYFGVRGGQTAIIQLVDKWRNLTTSVYPALIGEDKAEIFGFRSARLIPIALMLGWLLVGIVVVIEIWKKYA